MKRDLTLFAEDMLQAICKIRKYAKGYTFERFSNDEKTAEAIILNFAILGEAAKKIPPQIRKMHPKIPWRGMTGMRDKLVHEYFGIRYDVVWKTITRRLPKLEVQIRSFLKALEKEKN